MNKILIAALGCVTLSACGGSGGSSTVEVTVQAAAAATNEANAGSVAAVTVVTETEPVEAVASESLDSAAEVANAYDSAGITDPATFSSAFATGTDNTDFASVFNSLRLSRGNETVSFDERLGRAAQKYAVEQSSISGLSHIGVDGSTVQERIQAEGYDPRGWAENLAKGYDDQGAVLQAWIDSSGHNENLNAGLEDFALGAAGSGSQLSWVLVLATEK